MTLDERRRAMIRSDIERGRAAWGADTVRDLLDALEAAEAEVKRLRAEVSEAERRGAEKGWNEGYGAGRDDEALGPLCLADEPNPYWPEPT